MKRGRERKKERERKRDTEVFSAFLLLLFFILTIFNYSYCLWSGGDHFNKSVIIDVSVKRMGVKKKRAVTFGPKCLILIISVITFPTDYTSRIQRKKKRRSIHKQLDESHIRPWQLKMTLLWKRLALLSIMGCLAGKTSYLMSFSYKKQCFFFIFFFYFFHFYYSGALSITFIV